jgi:hypothetical protein
MDSLAKDYGVGVSFEPENVTSLANALVEAMTNYGQLKNKAILRRDAVRTAFSARTFLNIIAGLPQN